MLPPVACSLRVAASPLKGATPTARQSRFRGVPGRVPPVHAALARQGHCGFTLIELLVAISILAVMAVLSWRGLEGMTRAVAQNQQRADQVLTLQVGLDQWTRDLDALMQLPQVSALDWDGRVLRMTRPAPEATDGMLVVAWSRRDVDGTGQWLRWQSPPLHTQGDLTNAWAEAAQWAQNPGDEEKQREVAITPLLDWQIFYFRSDAWSNPLSSDGAAVTASPAALAQGAPNASVPDGVRLVLTLPPGQALSGTLTLDWVRPTLGGNKS